jgi:hypothetical protein
MAADHAGLQLLSVGPVTSFDNAAMATFWATLKREIAHIRGASGIWFDTRDAVRVYLFEFIEVFYNGQRHQAGLETSARPSTPPGFRERP